MFNNSPANIGIIAGGFFSSPNIITPKLTWNFNNVITFDFPPRLDNRNDRPRINVWRSVSGIPDSSYLQFISGGNLALTPSPTGEVKKIYTDRVTGSLIFNSAGINENTVAGIDVFIHSFSKLNNLTPPLNQWTIDSGSISAEYKYQYIFKTGDKFPNFNIDLTYDPSLPCVIDINENSCIGQNVGYLGTGSNGCPQFICSPKVFKVERGALYFPNTSYLWETPTANRGGFGYWEFWTGANSYRTIANSNQNGRQSIGDQSFFIVGTSGYFGIPHYHYARFSMIKPYVSSGTVLSFNANFSWFAGNRNIYVITGKAAGGTFNPGDFIDNTGDYLYKIDHWSGSGDALIFNRKGFGTNPPINNRVITGNAFNKAFQFRIDNSGSLLSFEVRASGVNHVLFRDYFYRDSGVTLDFIKSIGFRALTPQNLNTGDWFNYGMFFNDITITEDARFLDFDVDSSPPIWNFSNILTGLYSGQDFGTSISFDPNGSILLIGAPGMSAYNIGLPYSGSAFVYTGSYSNGWRLRNRLSGNNLSLNFGNKVCMNNSGNILIIGSDRDSNINGNAGSLFVYTGSRRNGWTFNQKLTGSNQTNTYYGYNFNINQDGNILVVNELNNNEGSLNAGLLYIYTGSNLNNWGLKQKIPGNSANQLLGKNLAINNDGSIILATTESVFINNKGTVRIYTGSINSNWNFKENLSATASGDIFGTSVAINYDASVIAVGFINSGENNIGGAYIYTGNSSNGWIFKQKIMGDLGNANYGNFINSIQIDKFADTIVIGGPFDSEANFSAGAMLAYTGSPIGGWRLKQKLLGDFPSSLFGLSVGVNNYSHTLAMGGPGSINTQSGIRGGAVFIYGGSRWRERTSSPLWVDVAVSKNGQYQLAAARDRLWVSNDYGRNWNPKTPIIQTSPNDKWDTWTHVTINEDGKYQSATRFISHIWTSSDYGENWSIVNTPKNIWRGIDMSYNGKYQTAIALPTFSQNDPEIWISEDYGFNWSGVNVVQGANTFIQFSKIAVSRNGLYQSAIGDSLIYTSSNGGKTWSNYYEGANWTDIKILDDGQNQIVVECTLSSGNIWFSNDYGQNWIYKGRFGNFSQIAVSNNGQYQTAIGPNQKIYTSDDYGNNWFQEDSARNWTAIGMSANGLYQTAVTQGVDGKIFNISPNIIVPKLTYEQPKWYKVINTNQSLRGIAMSDDGKYQTAVAGSISGNIWVSSNTGVTWNIVPNLYAKWNGIAMSSGGRYQTAVAYESGIFISNNTGVTWSSININKLWVAVAMSKNGQYQTAVAYDDKIWSSADFGQSWFENPEAPRAFWNDVAVSYDGAWLFAISANKGIYRSYDFGFQWTSYNSLNLPQSPQIALNDNGFIVSLAANYSQIFVSKDSAGTWEPKNYIKQWRDIAMSKNGQYQTAVAYDDLIYTSNDTGQNWFSVSNQNSWWGVAMSSDAQNQTAITLNGEIYKNIPTPVIITIPVAPNQPTFTNVTDNSFTVNWNNISNATGYFIDISRDEIGDFSNIVLGYNNLPVTTNSINVIGLFPNSTYFARVRAANQAGVSSNSAFLGKVTAPQTPSPNVSNITSNSFIVSWAAISGADNYHLDIARNSTFTNIFDNYNPRIINGITHTVTGLQPLTTYFVKLRSVSAAGSSNNSQILIISTTS